MKLQNLAIIFIIIILPISLVLATYTKSRVDTISNQSQYDSKLNDATHDALKAYQINSFSSNSSDLTNSKIRDIKGSVNTFFNSMASNFSTLGHTKETLQNYVPALVYTMYDGYYIYSPYVNTWDKETEDYVRAQGELYKDDPYYEQSFNKDEILFGLKPYVYYSCRYKKGTDTDVVITYSLDNYIQIQGLVSGEAVSKYGYLLDVNDSNFTGDVVNYQGATITTEGALRENIYVNGHLETNLQYMKKNGVKYYIDENSNILGKERDYVFSILNDGTALPQSTISAEEIKSYAMTNGTYEKIIKEDGTMTNYSLPYLERNRTKYYVDQYREVLGEESDYIFSISNNNPGVIRQESTITANEIKYNNNAKKYYQEANELRKFIEGSPLSDLKTVDIVDMDTGKTYVEEGKEEESPYYAINGKIFDFGNIESKTSNFNTHRIDVVKNAIVRNLSIAISNFNNYSGVNVDFQMPKLKDSEWDKIMDNISIISFFQGVNIGGKVYNGYSIVTNTKNEDVVMEDSIYIKTVDATNGEMIRHITERNLQNNLTNAVGIFNINTEVRTGADGQTYYLPVEGTLSYDSIVTKNNISDDYNGNLRDYINTKGELKKLYYTALARERYSLYRQKLEI